jgi:hypothetical protein
MAQGDVIIFDQFLLDMWKGSAECPHDWGATPDAVYCALVNNSTVPTTTTADPHWNGTGTTNFQANEITPGGNYAADGKECTNVTVALNGGAVEFDMGDPAVWASHASNPTDAYWAIFYNSTSVGKEVFAAMDLGGVFDMTTGPLTITLAAPFHTVNQA